MDKMSFQTTAILLIAPALLLGACSTTSAEFTPPATISLPSETPPRPPVTSTAATPVTEVSPTAPPPTLPVATPTATLTAEQREGRVLELLHTNAGCPLPCWWGIKPGKTTWAEAQLLLESIGIETVIDQTTAISTTYGARGVSLSNLDISLGVGFIVRDGVVEEIGIGSSTTTEASWLKAWAGYSPQQIMLRYGAPDRVWLMTSSGFREPPEPAAGSPNPYQLWLFYDHHKFEVDYGGVLKYGPVYQFCPEYGDNGQLKDRIGLYLADSDNPTPLETLSNAVGLPGMLDYIQPIEKATGMTTERFASLFTQSRKVTCFDTPRSIWAP